MIKNIVIAFLLILPLNSCDVERNEINTIEIRQGSRSTYVFSQEGNEILEVNFDEQGNVFSVITHQGSNDQALFFYEDNGALKSKTILRPDGGIVGSEYFFFKETGLLKSYFEYKDTIPQHGVLFYDTVGREKTVLFFDEKGELEEKIEISRDGETIISYGRDSIRRSIDPIDPIEQGE